MDDDCRGARAGAGESGDYVTAATAFAAPAPPAASAGSAAIRERVLAARAGRRRLRIAGARTWPHGGRPIAADEELLVPSAGEPVEYVPGDLTITVPAGMSLGRLRAILAAERQWLALDPAGSEEGMIGATVATASAGPLSHAFGTPRDQVLGLEMVTGTGDVVRGGGRVVKNVAGFDLARLAVGSWGAIGVVTEVTLRLRAAPAVEMTLALATPSDAAGLEAFLSRLRQAPAAPWTLELLDPAAARLIGLPNEPVTLARLGGTESSVLAQRRALERIADAEPVLPSVWPALRGLDRDARAVARWSDWPSALPALLPRIRHLLEPHEGASHTTLGRGVVRALLRAGDDAAIGATLNALPDVPVIVERAPAAVWSGVAPSAGDRLSRRVLDAFNPGRVLNPGILGEGAA